jgi:integrase
MEPGIQKRTGKRGVSYLVRVDIGLDPQTGERRQRAKTFSTLKEARAARAQWITEINRGTVVDSSRTTLREYLEQWLKATETTLKPATHRRYSDLVRLHITPLLGHVMLAKLTALDVQRWHTELFASGLSATTVRHVHFCLHRALEQAVRWSILDRNITRLVSAPPRTMPDVDVWDKAQVAAFLAAGDENKLAALWRLALMTGMRRGELLGLQWGDVDLDRGEVSVRRTLSRGRGGTWELGSTKTKSGRRSIALPHSCVNALRKHKAAQNAVRLQLGELWEEHDFVFTNPTGGPLHVNSLMMAYEHVVKAAGVRRIRFHDLRHTAATLMLANNEHPKIVQERLGHATISMTLDRYSHVTMDMQRQAADRLDELFSTSA